MNNSQKIVRWLIEIEQLAGDLYSGSELLFTADRPFSEFLGRLAEDEAWHYHLMGSAADFLRKEGDEFHEIKVDPQTREGIETPLIKNYAMLTAGTLTKESLIDCIITTEYSEWNHIFLYVVNTLKERKREFGYVASRMQMHVSAIEQFLTQLPRGSEYADRISGITGVWKKKILVVDDHGPTAELMPVILESEGTVVTARNGLEAYEMVVREFYDAIITDIEMPVMDGIDFYKKTVAFDRNLRERFLFFSSTFNDEHLRFIHQNNLRLLKKPADINDIRQSVRTILTEASVKG